MPWSRPATRWEVYLAPIFAACLAVVLNATYVSSLVHTATDHGVAEAEKLADRMDVVEEVASSNFTLLLDVREELAARGEWMREVSEVVAVPFPDSRTDPQL